MGRPPPTPPPTPPILAQRQPEPDPQPAGRTRGGHMTARSGVIISGIFVLVSALITAVATLVPPMFDDGDGGSNADTNPYTNTNDLTVVVQVGGGSTPDTGGVSPGNVDPCLVGRWFGTAYNRTMQVDDVEVTLTMVSGTGFGLTIGSNGSGRESLSTRPLLRGSAGGYTVAMVEAGDSTFTVGGRGGVLILSDYSGSYDFAVSINGQLIPKDQFTYTEIYQIHYDCSGSRLVLTTDFYRMEYRRS
jgi:hypothetical protein